MVDSPDSPRVSVTDLLSPSDMVWSHTSPPRTSVLCYDVGRRQKENSMSNPFPCVRCVGDGEIDCDTPACPDRPHPCERCEGMPKLDSRQYPTIPRTTSDGWFKPDPDSIMRWCFKHKFPGGSEYDICEYLMVGGDGCDLGWIADPTRLESL